MTRTRAVLLVAAAVLALLSIAVLFIGDVRVLSHPLLAIALMLCVLAETLPRRRP